LTIVLPIFYTALFILLINRWRFFTNSGLGNRLTSFLFTLKILAGVGLTLVYTYYYTDRSTSDIYKYFDDGKVIYNVIKESPSDYAKLVTGIDADDPSLEHYLDSTKNWLEISDGWLNLMKVKNYNYFNSNRLVTRFNAVVMIFSQGNIYVHVVFMCFLALLGSVALYKALANFYKGKEKLLVFFIFLMPSILFWQSGVLKEGILIFSTGLFIYHLFTYLKSKKWVNAFCVLLFFAMIVLCKYYVAIALLPGIIAYTWQALTGGENAGYKYVYTYMGIMAALVIILYIFPERNPLITLCNKRSESVKSAVFAEAKEILFMDNVQPYPAEVAKKIPQIFRVSFIEPMKLTKNPLMLLATLENALVILIILLFSLYSKRRSGNVALYYFLLSYAFIMLFIIAFTTPVTGGLVRYKTAAIPFLMLALLLKVKPIKLSWFNAGWRNT
jgi:hypothetical protein